MLKISELSGNRAVTLKLEGRLIGPWVGELRTTCEECLRTARRVNLDFAGVSYADREGVALMVTLRERGVGITNCAPFLAAELLAHSL
jgi:ABC-type transporter Mla MlaB component